MKKRGILYVLSAPSGAGKGTILEKIMNDESNMRYSVSATTREARRGEVDGVNYTFLSKEKFNNMIDNDELIEWTEYCGNYYGTQKTYVEKNLEIGYDVILEIEVEGAKNIKEIYSDCVMIFILPPSIEELERRIRKRDSETEQTIEKRLNEAKNEIKHCGIYDYVVVNERLEKAVYDIESIFNAEKHKVIRNREIIVEAENLK